MRGITPYRGSRMGRSGAKTVKQWRYMRTLGVLTDIDKVRRRISNGDPAYETEVPAVANLLALATDESRPHWWAMFQQILLSSFDRLSKGWSRVDVEYFCGFIAGLAAKDIKQVVRRDRHVWNMCLHIVRVDGAWIACDVQYDGLCLMGGGGPGIVRATLGQHSDIHASGRSILADSRSGSIYRGGETAATPHIVFRNDRVLDLAHSFIKARAVMHALGEDLRPVRLNLDATCVFFDPSLVMGATAFHYFGTADADNYRAMFHSGASILESFYMAQDGGDTIRDCCSILSDGLYPLRAERSARDPGTFRLGVAIELEKRVWVQQIPALGALFECLLSKVPSCEVYVIGMTGSTLQKELGKFQTIYEREALVIQAWSKQFQGRIQFRHLFGLSLQEKIPLLSQMDFFVAPAGTAAVIPSLAGVPGVCYSHPQLSDAFRAHLAPFSDVAYICRSKTTDARDVTGLIDYEWAKDDGFSYGIAVDDFLDECLPHFARAKMPLSLEPGRPKGS